MCATPGGFCGGSSEVESLLAMQVVEGSNPFFRSNKPALVAGLIV